MMPTEDLICTGCGFLAKIKWMMDRGGRLHRKKSKGGLWNETQHSKIVLDWQGRNPVFLPKKKKAGIRNLEIIDDFAKNPWCLGLWTRQEKIHIIPALAVYVHLASRTGFHRRRSDQKSQPKAGSWDQWTKIPFSVETFEKKSHAKVSTWCASTLKRIVNESTRRLETAWEPNRSEQIWDNRYAWSAWLCTSGHAWMGMNECMHACMKWKGMEWNGNYWIG